jgi:hypothetical protein
MKKLGDIKATIQFSPLPNSNEPWVVDVTLTCHDGKCTKIEEQSWQTTKLAALVEGLPIILKKILVKHHLYDSP